jgi:hypothetical protein
VPDITMCKATTCTYQSNCYRHEDSGTKPCPRWQSYFVDAPYDEKTETCDAYWSRR